MRITLTSSGECISKGKGGCSGGSLEAVEIIQVRDGGGRDQDLVVEMERRK